MKKNSMLIGVLIATSIISQTAYAFDLKGALDVVNQIAKKNGIVVPEEQKQQQNEAISPNEQSSSDTYSSAPNPIEENTVKKKYKNEYEFYQEKWETIISPYFKTCDEKTFNDDKEKWEKTKKEYMSYEFRNVECRKYSQEAVDAGLKGANTNTCQRNLGNMATGLPPKGSQCEKELSDKKKNTIADTRYDIKGILIGMSQDEAKLKISPDCKWKEIMDDAGLKNGMSKQVCNAPKLTLANKDVVEVQFTFIDNKLVNSYFFVNTGVTKAKMNESYLAFANALNVKYDVSKRVDIRNSILQSASANLEVGWSNEINGDIVLLYTFNDKVTFGVRGTSYQAIRQINDLDSKIEKGEMQQKSDKRNIKYKNDAKDL